MNWRPSDWDAGIRVLLIIAATVGYWLGRMLCNGVHVHVHVHADVDVDVACLLCMLCACIRRSVSDGLPCADRMRCAAPAALALGVELDVER